MAVYLCFFVVFAICAQNKEHCVLGFHSSVPSFTASCALSLCPALLFGMLCTLYVSLLCFDSYLFSRRWEFLVSVPCNLLPATSSFERVPRRLSASTDGALPASSSTHGIAPRVLDGRRIPSYEMWYLRETIISSERGQQQYLRLKDSTTTFIRGATLHTYIMHCGTAK